MRRVICGLMLSAATSLSAWQTEDAFEIAVTNALCNRGVLTSVAFTNELSQYVSSVSNCDSSLTAHLMEAICLYELYERNADDTFLHRSIDVASNCVMQTYSQHGKWQCWMSRLILMGGLATCNNPDAVYEVATNALAGMSSSGFQGSTNRVAMALIRYHDVPDLTVPDTVRAFSAIAAAQKGLGCVATNLCSTFPARYKLMVDECMSQ